MFQYPVTEIYYPTGDRKCVFSAEEYDVKIADGWSDSPFAPVAATVLELELMNAEAPAPAKRRKK